jgi:hypothetical protein
MKLNGEHQCPVCGTTFALTVMGGGVAAKGQLNACFRRHPGNRDETLVAFVRFLYLEKVVSNSYLIIAAALS